ncbi:MAG: glycogen/starch/alpha-glucan phosphorylase [Opitutales bacterium]
MPSRNASTQKKKNSRQRSAEPVEGDATLTRPSFKFNKGHEAEDLQASILNHLKYTLARDTHSATRRDWWISTSFAVRDRILQRFMKTQEVHNKKNTRRTYYLSLEYLMGRLLRNNCFNAGLADEVRAALDNLGLAFDDIEEEENDMGLGNGGLGRLAACFLDSLATLDLPAIGYGIHYQFGLFRQDFQDGRQVEHPDDWMQGGDPWRISRPEYKQEIPVYGRVEMRYNDQGDFRPEWVDTTSVVGLPHDIPICGYGAMTVNFLRLWESKASEEFDLDTFNRGGYVEAVREKAIGETISKVLYPNDATESGKELRLVQQYFFVACSLRDIIRRYFKKNDTWEAFPDKVAIQLNDTHPAVAVPELMRLLVDEHFFPWERAWDLTRRTFSYTNHTLLPEALEKWSVPLFQKVLPRHLQIIFEINRRFLEEEVEACWPGDGSMKTRLSLIEEEHPPMIRMAYLSVIASHTVNGVAALHTELLKRHLFKDFHALYPEKIQNKTNGITPRRWLLACNPELADLITARIGDGWVTDLPKLKQLDAYADDPEFQRAYMAVKQTNKENLVSWIRESTGVEVSPDAIFDVQIKRLHEYKRQHLNLLHILTLYRRLLHNPDLDIQPRVFIFGAKAAPGYDLAKEIIRAINCVGATINNDARIQGKLKVVFPPNYRVTVAEKIIPAADLSEQISTAGKEASGTGNMKLALNGALTIGTLDGANVEIRDEVGEENIFIFGLKVDEVEALREQGYNPWDYYHRNQELRDVVNWLCSDTFTPGEKNAFRPIRESLLEKGDPFFVLADYEAYVKAQEAVDLAYRDRKRWARMAILNTARVGKFSTDRTITEYARDIWNLEPLPVS